MHAKQLAEIGEEVGREGGKEGGTGGRLWCVVGDFNVHGPRVLGVGSLVDQVSDQKEGGVGGRRRSGKKGRELFAVPSEMRLIFFSPPLPLHPSVPL
jgi:hypothetical protein